MADGKEYVSRPDELGNIHISEEVLAVIAAAAAMEVEGVGSLAANLGSDIAELLGGKKNLSKGIHIAVEEESIRVDVSPYSSSMAIPLLMWRRRSKTRYTVPSRTPAA